MKLFTIGKFLITCLLLLSVFAEAEAQTLQKSVQKIMSYKNISYTDIVRTKFSFQEDFSADTLQSQLFIVSGKSSIGGYYQIKGHNNSYFFDGNKLVYLNLTDSTYQVQKESVEGQNTRTLFYWAGKMDKLVQSAKKISQLPDTMINTKTYTNIRVTESDTIENNVHNYSITDFIIDKKTNLPAYIISKFKGNADDGSNIGLIETHTYNNYKFDQKNFPDLSVATIPDHFKLPAKRVPVEFLPNGTIAPPIKAFDMAGNAFDLEKLKGKMILINFSLIGCPHCVGAAQMLNRLNEKYKEKGLVIVNIYPVDQKDAIIKFDKKENVTPPSYTSERAVQKSYPYDGYPSFYLLDKNGLVAQSYNGYYKALESELTKKLDVIY